MGVTKVVLYDNGSTDNVTGILAPYIKEETVTIIPWKSNISLNHPKYNPQIVALNDCLWRYFVDFKITHQRKLLQFFVETSLFPSYFLSYLISTSFDFCRYRQFSRYQIHIDVDEFPYPLSHEIRDLLSLIEDIEHTNPQWHTLKLTVFFPLPLSLSPSLLLSLYPSIPLSLSFK
jgi:hypothetical protein